MGGIALLGMTNVLFSLGPMVTLVRCSMTRSSITSPPCRADPQHIRHDARQRPPAVPSSIERESPPRRCQWAGSVQWCEALCAGYATGPASPRPAGSPCSGAAAVDPVLDGAAERASISFRAQRAWSREKTGPRRGRVLGEGAQGGPRRGGAAPRRSGRSAAGSLVGLDEGAEVLFLLRRASWRLPCPAHARPDARSLRSWQRPPSRRGAPRRGSLGDGGRGGSPGMPGPDGFRTGGGRASRAGGCRGGEHLRGPPRGRGRSCGSRCGRAGPPRRESR